MALLSFLPTRNAADGTGHSHSSLRHIEVERTAGDRRFVSVAAGVAVLLTVVLVVLSVVADPLAAHGTGWFAPLVPNDRDTKVSAFLRAPVPPKAIILGSSRVMMLPPVCMAQLTGQPAFNLGFNSARAEDYEAAFRFAAARGPVTHVVIGLDPEALHDTVPTDDRLLHSRTLAPYLDPDVRLPWWSSMYASAADALSLETVSGSVRVLRFALLGGRPAPAYEFAEDGLIQHTTHERLVREGRFDLAAAIRASVVEYTSRYAGFGRLSPERVQRFERFLREARQAGARVDAFIPPLHPDLVAALRSTSVDARTADTVALLSGYEAQGLLRFTRVERLDQFGGDPLAFSDGAHLTTPNGLKLLAAVYGTVPCAVQ